MACNPNLILLFSLSSERLNLRYFHPEPSSVSAGIQGPDTDMVNLWRQAEIGDEVSKVGGRTLDEFFGVGG